MKAEQTVYQLKEIFVVKATIYGLKKHSQETERDNGYARYQFSELYRTIISTIYTIAV